MSDISSQLIKDSYNYVLQSDVSTGNIYRIGGGIPVNPIFLSGLTVNGELNATSISATTITTPFSGGSVLFAGTSGQISQNNSQLFWDDTNYRLGIRTNTPAYPFQLLSTALYDTVYASFDYSGGTRGSTRITEQSIQHYYNSGKRFALTRGGGTDSNQSALQFGPDSTSGAGISTPNSTSNLIVFNSNGTTLQETTRFTSTNNVLIGTSIDSGYRLDVSGTARTTGKIQSLGFYININNGIGISSPATGMQFAINDNGANVIGNSRPFFSFANNGTVINRTSGTGKWFELVTDVSFAPIGGNCTMDWMSIAPTINQTGGASGTTRGLYINPTLTSAFDFRAIETVTGNVILGSTSGNTLIGTSVDTGYKLNVNGTVRVQNSLYTGGITISQTANSTGVITGGPASENITFGPSNRIFINAGQVSISYLYLLATINSSPLGSSSGSSLNLITGSGFVGAGSVEQNHFKITSSVALQNTGPSFNALQIQPTINNTTTTGAIVRGIYYNPTLTSLIGTTHTSIETVTGNVILGSTNGNTLIGTSVDAGYKLDVSGTTRLRGTSTELYVNSNSTINGTGRFLVLNSYASSSPVGLVLRTTSIETARIVTDDASGNLILQNSWTNYAIQFNTSGANERMRIVGSNGNVLIGTSVDAGFKLDVSGNTRISGGLTATTVSATTYQGVTRSFGVSFDGMGSVITVNSQSTLTIPYNMVIQSWVLLSDVTGSTVIDIWKDTYSIYPPTSGDSITSLAKPNIVSGIKNQSSTLTGWNTIVNSGDIIRFNVDSCTGMTKATLTIIGKEF
jgi:hypothetical protein